MCVAGCGCIGEIVVAVVEVIATSDAQGHPLSYTFRNNFSQDLLEKKVKYIFNK